MNQYEQLAQSSTLSEADAAAVEALLRERERLYAEAAAVNTQRKELKARSVALGAQIIGVESDLQRILPKTPGPRIGA
jgi:anti-sigma factor RsiW